MRSDEKSARSGLSLKSQNVHNLKRKILRLKVPPELNCKYLQTSHLLVSDSDHLQRHSTEHCWHIKLAVVHHMILPYAIVDSYGTYTVSDRSAILR